MTTWLLLYPAKTTSLRVNYNVHVKLYNETVYVSSLPKKC